MWNLFTKFCPDECHLLWAGAHWICVSLDGHSELVILSFEQFRIVSLHDWLNRNIIGQLVRSDLSNILQMKAGSSYCQAHKVNCIVYSFNSDFILNSCLGSFKCITDLLTYTIPVCL